jgi:glycine betaine catabolism A
MPSLERRVPGFGLSRPWYHSVDVYEEELSRIWRAGWIFAGFSCEIPQPGDYITLTCGSDPLVVLRDDSGEVRAFHNLCTHRGTVLCREEAGTVGRALVCPYHQWTFTRQGDLLACRGMHEGVDRTDLGLRKVAVEEVAGMIFVSESASPPDFAQARQTLAAAEPQGFRGARIAVARDYTIAANWKIVWENNRECYHCDVNHPQYIKANFDIIEAERATPAMREEIERRLAKSEAFWKAEGLSVKHAEGGLATFPDPVNDTWYSASRTIFSDGFETESMDGRRVAPLMGSCRGGEEGALRLRTLPNFWCHASCDHAVFTRLLPAGPRTTLARVYWLVDASARENVDYQLERIMPFWQLTSEQDWELCERVQQGVDSTAFRPGPLSETREYNLEAFFQWYERRIGEP